MNFRLRELRNKKGYSQEDLSNILHVTQQAISKWENGSAEPDKDTIRKLSDLYNVTTDYIISGKEQQNNNETMIKVYSFSDEKQALKYRKLRLLGTAGGAIFFFVLSIFSYFTTPLLFSGFAFAGFFLATRECMLTLKLNKNIPNDQLKRSLMNRCTPSFYAANFFGVLTLFEILFNWYNGSDGIILFTITGLIVIASGLLTRQFKLFYSNNVREEIVPVSTVSNYHFPKRYTPFDIVGRGIAIILMIAPLCVTLLTTMGNAPIEVYKLSSSTHITYTITATDDIDVDTWVIEFTSCEYTLTINNKNISSGTSTSVSFTNDLEKGDVVELKLKYSGLTTPKITKMTLNSSEVKLNW